MPIAGCLLLALNYRSLKKPGPAWHCVIWGLVSSALLLVISFWLPENFPNMVLPVAYCFGLRQLALNLQGKAISDHNTAGGRKGSWAVTVAVGIACLVIVLGVVFGVIMVASMFE